MIYWQMKLSKKCIFNILFVVMACYYSWRMFSLTPWYDELYTYYYFISKGPVYAAIHWPLPNNHVGYSVLSAFLDYLGNPYIGLRGVSYLCALINMVLLYRIAGKYLREEMAVCTVVLYISMNLVNQLAVQGRGYTMGITCFLLALGCMISIYEQDRTPRRVYAAYVASLVMGLYTVSSDVYWVLPLCMAGGSALLIQGVMEYRQKRCSGDEGSILKTTGMKKLFRLIAASLTAALFTLMLYAVIWAAIGSNLLVKEEGGRYYGMGHVQLLLKAPFAAVSRGMEYMLATPYIQSEQRAGFAGRLAEWLRALAEYYYSSLSLMVIAVWLFGVLYLIYKLVREIRQGEKERLLFYLVLIMEITLVPIFLLIQCKRPYYRVFTYGGVALALLLAVLWEDGLDWIRGKAFNKEAGERLYGAVLILAVLFAVKCFCFSDYNSQYGMNEHEIADAFSHAGLFSADSRRRGLFQKEVSQVSADQPGKICVTDCDQEYLLYFLYGIRCENREIQGADVVLLDKRMTDPEFHEMVWEFYHYYDTIPWDYIQQNMEITYENENNVLYTIKGG